MSDDEVIPRRVRQGQSPRVCACQYGPCGHCDVGRHEDCTAGKLPPGGRETPATYVIGRDGLVPAGNTAQVWEVGHSHRWVCSCHRARHGGKRGPISQGDLLDLLAGAA